jgi:cephalosporin hydroxylase
MDAIIKDIYSKLGFEELTKYWLKSGWQNRVPYTYSWMGFQILQIPDDMIRAQEVIFATKPDLIIETGVAGGGSVVYYASLMQLIGHGHVLGIEKGLRCREKVEASVVADRITLIEGDSTSPEAVAIATNMAKPKKRVLVMLDSNHSWAHVAKELKAYAPLVTPGSYIVVCDSNMADLADLPRGNPEWETDNPRTAAEEFLRANPQFYVEQPPWPHNDSELRSPITYWPNAWLKRK